MSSVELNLSHSILHLKNISKKYKINNSSVQTVLNGVNLKVSKGEFITIIGKSGCGKSTLLSILAGLDKSFTGELLVDDKPVSSSNGDRIVVFQENSLFPWLNVIQNIEFGLRQAKVSKNLRKSIAMNYLNMVGLSDFAYANIHELSGGMKQRISIARALSLNPRIILMDEPFASLDTHTRQSLQSELLQIHEQTKKTILFVTHNIEEAVLLGDRVIILSNSTGSFKREFIINVPRPRNLNNPTLKNTVFEALDELRKDYYDKREYANPIPA